MLKRYNYKFKYMPSKMFTDEKRLETWKKGIIKDIFYEGNHEIENDLIDPKWLELPEETTIWLTVSLFEDREEIITCALHNLHGAQRLEQVTF